MIEIFRRHPALGFILTGLLAFFASALLQSSGNFPDPDSFYHARMALLIRDQGIIRDFPWLTQTVFTDSYVDHHFLYHLLLIPFVSLPDPLLGMRISAVVFGVSAMVGAALLLRSFGVAGAAFSTLALAASNPFLFRMNLAKTPSLSLLMVFLGLWAAFKSKPLILAAIAFAYVWLYDGWPILLVVVASYILAEAIVSRSPRALVSRRNLALSGGVVLGIITGHVINPYFPENIPFEWLHIVRVGIIGFRDQFGVGQEWYPWKPQELLASSSLTFILLLSSALFGLVASLIRSRYPVERERLVMAVALGILVVVACVFTLKAKRNVEYFVPFAVLFAFSAIDCARRKVGSLWFQEMVGALKGWRRAAAIIVAAFFALTTPLLAARDVLAAKRDFESGIPPDKYEKLSAWLQTNTSKGSIIFHNDWDDFPYFFIRNTHNRYLVGLDPAFMFVKNPERFREWVETTQGRDLNFLGARIYERFGAEYAFVDRDHQPLEAALSRDPLMRLVYSDEEGKIYQFVPPPGFVAR